MVECNPCCCVSLRTGAYITAVLEIVCALVVILLLALEPIYDALEIIGLAFDIGHLVLWILHIIFASLLIHGVRKENLKLLKLWILFQIFSMLLDISAKIVLAFLTTIFYSEIYFACGYLITLYFIYVVYCLYAEILNDKLENL